MASLALTRWRFLAPAANDSYSDDIGYAVSLLSNLQSLHEAIIGGHLARFEDLVFAEAFADLLEQADYLFDQGYTLAAGVIARAVLEERLNRMCNANSCVPSKPRPIIRN